MIEGLTRTNIENGLFLELCCMGMDIKGFNGGEVDVMGSWA